MSSKRRLRRTKCESKTRFRTAAAAKRRAQEIFAAGGDLMNGYPCKHCHQYHLGHMPARIEAGRAFGAATVAMIRRLDKGVATQQQS